jgi:hypothetical protein
MMELGQPVKSRMRTKEYICVECFIACLLCFAEPRFSTLVYVNSVLTALNQDGYLWISQIPLD